MVLGSLRLPVAEIGGHKLPSLTPMLPGKEQDQLAVSQHVPGLLVIRPGSYKSHEGGRPG